MSRTIPVDHYANLWTDGGPLPDVASFLKKHADATTRERVDVLLLDQRHRWRKGDRRTAEHYLRDFSEIASDPEFIIDLLCGEIALTMESGKTPDLDLLLARFPDLREELFRRLEVADWIRTEAECSLSGSRVASASGGHGAASDITTPNPSDGPGIVNGGITTDFDNGEGSDAEVNASDALTLKVPRLGRGVSGAMQGPACPAANGPCEDRPTAPWKSDASRRKLLPRKPTLPQEGWEIAPGYFAQSELGRGGMGVVYKALDLKLNRLVALKMIRGGSNALAENLTRFQIEAEAVARLRHPNILQIYQIGEVEGLPFVAFELLQGGTLSRRLAGTPQPLREAAALLATLARAVHAAHRAGIVHRDLKPANVLFDSDGIPKVADFGLAKRLEVEDGETRTGQVIGTPSYMAPEQAQGRGREVGPPADIYSLGAIFYELLTGRPPFKGTTSAETLMLVQTEDPLPPSRLRPRLPRDLETICLRCLAKEPQKRYPDASALADDLDRYLAGEPIRARPTPAWERGIKWARRRPATATLLALGLVAFAVAAGVVQRVETRARVEQRLESDRLGRIRVDVNLALFEAQKALAQGLWAEAREILSQQSVRIESEPRLADLKARADGLLAQARRGQDGQTASNRAHDRYRRFLAARDEALFLDTRFTGLDAPSDPEAACRAARAGLAEFGAAGPEDGSGLPMLPAALSARERSDVERGCYELLLVLADAIARSPGETPERRADQALRVLDQAARLRPSATRAYHLRRAACLALKGDAEGEARESAEVERVAPVDAFDFFLSGRERAGRQQWAAAVEDLDAALQREPEHFWAQCLLAICHLQTRQPSKARPSLNACLQRRPDLAWLYLLRGLTGAQAGELANGLAGRYPDQAAVFKAEAASQFERAEADYRTAVERIDGREGSRDLHYELLVNRGLIRFRRGRLDDAAADLGEAIRLNDRRHEAFASMGQLLQRQGRPIEAAEQFDRAIRLRPGWAPLYRGRAAIYLGLDAPTPEQRDAALSDLGEAIRLEPHAGPLTAADTTWRAQLLHQAGHHEEALVACEAALGIAPRYPAALRLRVRVLLTLKRYGELIPSCDAALATVPPSAELYELRGIAKDALKDFEGAIADYTQALVLRPESPRLRSRRGWSYLVAGAFRPALHDFDAAIRLNPSDPDAYNGRGNARAHLGLYREAVVDAEESLRRGEPSSRTAYNAARVYAQSAAAAASDAGRDPRAATPLVARYQDRAVWLIRTALGLLPADRRPEFWRDTIRDDPALRPIRRRLRSLSPLPPPEPSPGNVTRIGPAGAAATP